jgi:hypothetical protein
MNSVNMNRDELLKIVRENAISHQKQYEEAVVDYTALVLKITQHNVKVAKTGDLNEFKNLKPIPSAPTSYKDSYNRAIRMLELSVDSIIELEEHIFNQLVLDEWDWKRGFAAATMSYKAAL